MCTCCLIEHRRNHFLKWVSRFMQRIMIRPCNDIRQQTGSGLYKTIPSFSLFTQICCIGDFNPYKMTKNEPKLYLFTWLSLQNISPCRGIRTPIKASRCNETYGMSSRNYEQQACACSSKCKQGECGSLNTQAVDFIIWYKNGSEKLLSQ